MNTPAIHFGRGDRVPDFVLPIQDGTLTRFYAKAGGKPALLCFYDKSKTDELLHFLEAFNEAAPEDVSVFFVTRNKGEFPAGHEIHSPVFTDTEGKVWKAYRLEEDEKITIFALDPNLRVLESLLFEDAETTAQKIIPILDTLPEYKALKIEMQAPVLLIPNILDEKICKYLVDVWEAHGNVETGVEQSLKGQREDIINRENKRRRDHIVMDEKLLKLLSSTIGRRVMPELRKAFVYKATRFEGFKIACYDAETGGFFHAHRDNLSPSTAHRRFALTLNLNEDYEGGHLMFPEYGPHLYRQITGGAVVFSCSNLHAVTQVTKGRRFVLLSFLYGEENIRA